MKDTWALDSTQLTTAEPNTRRAVLPWSSKLQNGEALRKAYGAVQIKLLDLQERRDDVTRCGPRPKRLQWKPWQRFCRVHLFRVTIAFSEKLDLLHHFIWVNWPEAAALLDKLIDDSLELLFLSVIEHKIVKGWA